jgi:diguanylate cyclase (GGDEF)-like protein
MKTVKSYLKALGRGHTYNLRRNLYLWFGLFWGLPIPVFSMVLDLALSGTGVRSPIEIIRDHPIHLFFVAHPFLFALLFGTMGTVRRELELENARLIRRLMDEAITDPLTGLYNRRYMMEELKNGIHRARRLESPLTLIILDLNGFKTINEEHGHPAGDQALQQVAQALRSVARESDALGRYGGDEFLMVVAGDLDSAVGLLGRAEEAVRARAGLTFSAGISHWPEDGDSPEKLIAAADAVLGQAKKKIHETKNFARR